MITILVPFIAIYAYHGLRTAQPIYSLSAADMAR